MDAITFPPTPTNEPNLTYAPGAPEREALFVELDKLERREKDIKAHIG
ncbi:MAG: 1-pyrroline-5-carboxylate dehydrogenase, partial [Nocardioidaceae bacterium]|nr:1-pyrroline-5-carboxylate dehydrogenase [Nocardioidaceae bacterium]